MLGTGHSTVSLRFSETLSETRPSFGAQSAAEVDGWTRNSRRQSVPGFVLSARIHFSTALIVEEIMAACLASATRPCEVRSWRARHARTESQKVQSKEARRCALPARCRYRKLVDATSWTARIAEDISAGVVGAYSRDLIRGIIVMQALKFQMSCTEHLVARCV
mmetsp:Transcript_5755/g.9904  ORF Transcript_5755/g.9904 Transcript_5755/m.9904 type:complete len:164 (-) Transcript_5755:23-514(-)